MAKGIIFAVVLVDVRTMLDKIRRGCTTGNCDYDTIKRVVVSKN
jgi:hypothetical protein